MVRRLYNQALEGLGIDCFLFVLVFADADADADTISDSDKNFNPNKSHWIRLYLYDLYQKMGTKDFLDDGF